MNLHSFSQYVETDEPAFDMGRFDAALDSGEEWDDNDDFELGDAWDGSVDDEELE